MEGGIVLDLCGINQIEELNEEDEYVRVGTGVEWKRLVDHLERRGFQPGANPSSGPSATIGGYIGAGGGAGIGVSKYGVAGKVEWFYNLEGAGGGRGSVVKLDGTMITHTLDYELSREGVDDLKYLCKLEKSIALARTTGKARPEADAAAGFLKRLEDSIIPNWTAYSQGGMKWPIDGMEEVDLEKAATLGSLNTLRRAVADHIIAVENALKQ